MKKILYFFLVFFGIFFVYNNFDNKSINYVSFNDTLNCYNYNQMIKEYLEKNNKLLNFNDLFINKNISGLIKDIKNNRTIRYKNRDYYIKKDLRESDVLVISIGDEELSKYYDKYDLNKNYYFFNKMYNDVELLIKEINKYAKGKIFFLGYYNPTNYYDSKSDEFFFEIDSKLNNLMINNNMNYISLYEIIKGNNYKSDEIHLNNAGNKEIMNIIEVYLRKNT